MAAQTLKIGEREAIVDEAIVEKTRRLFAERIEQFFEDVEMTPAIEQNLFRIQLIIFLIDVHYEQNWEYDSHYLADAWTEILHLLQKLGMLDPEILGLLSEIRRYEKVEQNMRNGKKLHEYHIDEFYFLKSCDVRLQRRLGKFLATNSLVDSSEEESEIYRLAARILGLLDRSHV